MRRIVLALSLAALSLTAWLTPEALAQDNKPARGTLAGITANAIIVQSGDNKMTFTVDSNTDVVVRGGSTATRAAVSAGRAGPKLAELLKSGDAVEVQYREQGGTRTATMIRVIDAAAVMRAPAADDKSTGSAKGTVESLSGTSLTITGSSGGGASFKQTFTIDGTTRVIGVGAGTAAAARGGKVPVSELVGRGDRVSVSYHPVGTALHAAEIRVMEKAGK